MLDTNTCSCCDAQSDEQVFVFLATRDGGLMAIAPLSDPGLLWPPPGPSLRLVAPARHGGAAAGWLRRHRWWRAVPLCVLAGLLGVLAAPIEAFAPPGHAASALRPGTTYVVRPGDTLLSIARRLAPGNNPLALAARMAAATGSSAVVPGEHIVLP
jgi:hypothetical protein